MATMVAHQYTRTKRFRGKINSFLAFLLDSGYILKEDLGDREKIKELVVKNKFNISPKQIALHFSKRRVSLSGTKGQELFIAPHIAECIVEEIYNKNLHSIIAPQGSYFIISDDPVCVIGKDDDLLEINNLWNFKRDDGYSFILPISPRKAVVFGNNAEKYRQISDGNSGSLVVMVNSLSVNNTNEEFYSHTDNFMRDYKRHLITPGRLLSYKKGLEEIKNNPIKRVKFFTKYCIWKLKTVLIGLLELLRR